MAKYKCPSIGDCQKADSDEIFERSAGEDLKCPSCQVRLEPYSGDGANTVNKTDEGRIKKPVAAVVAAAVIALLGGGGYYFWSAQQQAAEKAAQVAREQAEAEKVAAQAKMEEERRQAAAANAAQQAKTRQQEQLIAQAVGLMAKGQLVDAEKKLGEASDIDSSNPLVSYNLAVLRLHQSRTDDALKALEDSFKLGFNHFDAMEQDHDLDGLRKHPKFKALVAQYRSKVQ